MGESALKAIKMLLTKLVTDSLLNMIFNLLFGLPCGKKSLGKKLRVQTSAVHKMHAHGALLADIARMLQTAVV